MKNAQGGLLIWDPEVALSNLSTGEKNFLAAPAERDLGLMMDTTNKKKIGSGTSLSHGRLKITGLNVQPWFTSINHWNVTCNALALPSCSSTLGKNWMHFLSRHKYRLLMNISILFYLGKFIISFFVCCNSWKFVTTQTQILNCTLNSFMWQQHEIHLWIFNIYSVPPTLFFGNC